MWLGGGEEGVRGVAAPSAGVCLCDAKPRTRSVLASPSHLSLRTRPPGGDARVEESSVCCVRYVDTVGHERSVKLQCVHLISFQACLYSVSLTLLLYICYISKHIWVCSGMHMDGMLTDAMLKRKVARFTPSERSKPSLDNP